MKLYEKLMEHGNPDVPNIIPLNSGRGGKSFLIIGATRTALIDCGMAYAGPKLAQMVSQVLKDLDLTRKLDYILLSHSHYDHIGGIPWLKRFWPEAKVLGAEYCKEILTRPNARVLIRQLSEEAARCYSKELELSIFAYDDDELAVDDVIRDQDIIDLGDTQIQVIGTPGHTRCSLSFYLPKEKVIFPSETTGVVEVFGESLTPGVLTSFQDAVESVIKCRKLNVEHLVSPHFGFLPYGGDVEQYWDLALKALVDGVLLILDRQQRGMTEDQILIDFAHTFRNGYSRIEQPYGAYAINTRSMIRAITLEFGQTVEQSEED